MPAETYSSPDLLAETQWLAERLTRRDLRIVDMGPYEGYLRAHMPGAVHPGPGDRSHYLKDRDDALQVMPPDQFADLMGRLGIGDGALVVAYDADGGHTAARLWWAMEHYGHPRCKVLNGGWNKWVLEKRAVSIEVPQCPRAKFTPRAVASQRCGLDELRSSIGRDDVVLWDVRSDGEWDGSNHRGNRRAGHLPGALHLEWRHLVTDDLAKTFKPASEMRRLLWERGITPNKRVITY